jgi:hypothetical protein
MKITTQRIGGLDGRNSEGKGSTHSAGAGMENCGKYTEMFGGHYCQIEKGHGVGRRTVEHRHGEITWAYLPPYDDDDEKEVEEAA